MRHACIVLLISTSALLAQKDVSPDDPLSRGREAFEEFQPADDSADNVALGEKARAAFEEVLAEDPRNKTALKYLASLDLRIATGTSDPDKKLAHLEAARTRFEDLASIDPDEKEAWYSLAMIDWYKWHPKWVEALERAKIQPEAPCYIPDEKIRRDLRESAGPFVQDGIAKLQRALQIDPQYADALHLMSTFFLEQASTCDAPEQYQRGVAEAEQLAQGMSPPVPTPPRTPSRIRVGGNVQALNLIRKVVPKYPKKARDAGIQGTVRFQVIIGKDGLIQNIQLVSGDPALVPSAQEAVQQWVYKPTLLNGQPVEVVTTIDVNFNLRR